MQVKRIGFVVGEPAGCITALKLKELAKRADVTVLTGPVPLSAPMMHSSD